MISNISNAVTVSNGQVTTSSLKISEVFGKKHCDVLRAIESLQVPDGFRKRNFALSEYSSQNGIGKTIKYPMYIITRDGFTLLVMGFTGAKAMQFKIAYLEEFNRMEAKLRELQAAPVQPELPMNAPAEPFSPLKYKGIEVIPGGELRMRLGITEGQLGFWLHRYNPMIEGVDVFHINGVTDKLAFAMLKSGFTVSPNIISVTLYTRSGFVKAAARFKPDLVQADFTRAMAAATGKELPLPRLAPDVSPDNFTFRAGWFDHDSKTTFGDTAIVRFCRELLNMGYDPSGLLSEFYAAHTAAAMGGKILDILYTITGDVLENSSLLAATSARMRIKKAEMANVSFHADGTVAG